MPPPATLTTPRLLLRPWTEADRAPFAVMNADPDVAAFLPNPLSRQESDRLIEAIERQFRLHGLGLWAVEETESGQLVGTVGLLVPGFIAHFTSPSRPAVEVAWRLGRPYWGKGYATEAARAALAFGFTEKSLGEIVSFTHPDNLRSIAVMERLGMTRDMDGDFEHPFLPAGHRLRPHVLYRLGLEAWRTQNQKIS
ncbi:MAG: GNAT family N-acetyltransferase [Cyanobacteria bacterium HKST-UBA04]|nr:GNAT family N-acetyltransferase [Cyanobacteria bacterium HKST-UBA04]